MIVMVKDELEHLTEQLTATAALLSEVRKSAVEINGGLRRVEQKLAVLESVSQRFSNLLEGHGGRASLGDRTTTIEAQLETVSEQLEQSRATTQRLMFWLLGSLATAVLSLLTAILSYLSTVRG